MAILRIPRRWRLRPLLAVVAASAVGLMILRIRIERAPIYRLIVQLQAVGAPMRAESARPALIRATRDRDRAVRKLAAWGLVRIAPVRGRPGPRR